MYRITELIRLNRHIYHSNDLAILWGITNRNTLYTTIKRYARKGILIPIYKGLYSTIPLAQVDPLELGKAIIHRYTYLSTETVLAQAGVIFQATYAYTFVSDESRRVSVGSTSYIFRKLKDNYLYNPSGVVYQDGNFIATPERAVADMLYFNPGYHFDLPESVDFEKVKLIQTEMGYSC